MNSIRTFICYLLFIIYKQNYCSVNRRELWKEIIHFGMPQKYVNLVKMCNDKKLLKVRYRNYHQYVKSIQDCSSEKLYPAESVQLVTRKNYTAIDMKTEEWK